mmetsp:Transcript_9021/g.28159  ORF Transcript_9021/g.28159 Transcript_9021/m.28159 type:complete len:310 (+) Transcript_9021:1145-2074(+)
MVNDGVRTVLATLRISFNRGTPSVTFFADTPAKWNVLSVICVAGSPMDCAASTPHISPACARAWTNRASTSPSNQSKAARVSLCSKTTLRAASCDRTKITNSCVASSRPSSRVVASAGSSSSAATTRWRHVRIVTQSFVTPDRTARGSRTASSSTSPHLNCFWADQISRSKFTGSWAKGSASRSGSRHAKMARNASRSSFKRASSASNKSSRSGSARHAAATSGSKGTPLVAGPRCRAPGGGSARLMAYADRSCASPSNNEGNFCFSTQAPSPPSSPYKNWTTWPWFVRTVPSYCTAVDSIDFTRRLCK